MIIVDGMTLTIKDADWFCTVIPNDHRELPQDFESYDEARAYADAKYGIGNYDIESPY